MKAFLTGITLLIIITLVYFLQGHNNLNKANSSYAVLTPTPNEQNTEPNQQAVTLDTNDNTPLPLEITTPANGSTISDSSVIVKGKTKPKATVFVNDLEINADANGVFTAPVDIYEGENTISILVHDEFGNYSEKELTVNGPASQ